MHCVKVCFNLFDVKKQDFLSGEELGDIMRFPFYNVLSSRRAKRAGWPKGLKGPKGPFGPLGQSACFGAGCYIEMATSCH